MAELNLDDLAVFVRVVDTAGFATAARDLGTTTSTISRAISRLEARIGARLLQRTTRSTRPTAEGRELYASVSPAIAMLRGATRAIEPASRKPKGCLRVTAPNDLCATFLADVIVAFTDRYPHVQVDFTLTNKHSNLIDEGFDVALRATGRLRDSSLVARKLGGHELRLYASPRYLQKYGTPAALRELQDHRCVVFRAEDLAQTWSMQGAGPTEDVKVQGRIGGDDFTFVRAIVLAGGGIGLLPHVICGADETDGQLIRVLPDVHVPGPALYIVYPSTRQVPARVTAFRDFVVEAYERWVVQRREWDARGAGQITGSAA